MMGHITHAGASHIGSRSRNDDRWAAHPDIGLFVLADGIATAPSAARAADLVVHQLPRYLDESGRADSRLIPGGGERAGEDLCRAVASMSDSLYRHTRRHSELAGTGTTVVAALVDASAVTVSHLGDSRAYLLRDGVLTQLTSDHTLAAALVEAGELTGDEVEHHPGRHRLTRFAGMRPPALPGCTTIDWTPGDRLMLSSDGLHNAVLPTAIRDILSDNATSCEKTCQRLIDAAIADDSADNTTVIVMHLDGGGPDSESRPLSRT
ncbi:PP2C family serine/threonine-protein phosphatase [Antrihabitans sp. YC2-6]|uniref:PP2C family protein-serine/threonine phosphatase n=1 Tax=Antrihabitans sp. YC2-6 TaxID=2799498 RepID=UPI001A279DB2|nr:protein phosphatase 2C domain-containing protein [Antrihabitans sp. YC2-6]MBJ8347086.1 serine/threonine-protein phosphatase [Antrihabitans sp. YC2-6]